MRTLTHGNGKEEQEFSSWYHFEFLLCSLFSFVVCGIYIWRNILVTNGKKLNQSAEKCTELFSRWVEGKKIENVYYWIITDTGYTCMDFWIVIQTINMCVVYKKNVLCGSNMCELVVSVKLKLLRSVGVLLLRVVTQPNPLDNNVTQKKLSLQWKVEDLPFVIRCCLH
jgi:hypothetical protein